MLRLTVIVGLVLVCANAVQELDIPTSCKDNPLFTNCNLVVSAKFCSYKYYSNFCCKSCVEAGQMDVRELELQADHSGIRELDIPTSCKDNPLFTNCNLVVSAKFCSHKYYSNFCCKSCVEAGQMDVRELELQADHSGIRELDIPTSCKDNPLFTNCNLVVSAKFCSQKYYSNFCCKSCVEAGQMDVRELELLADHSGIRELDIPTSCKDNPLFTNCNLVVSAKFCSQKYYSNFCCKSCVEAGQLDVRELELQADHMLYRY